MKNILEKLKASRFTIISWVVTVFVVVALLGSTIFYKNTRAASLPAAAQPTESASGQPQVGEPVAGSDGSGVSSINRDLQLKTNIPERPRYEAVTYRVTRGDAMLSIADEYKVKSETILYVNKQLEDNPHNLKPGMELTIPPVDGLYYEWEDGDTFESVAEKFSITTEVKVDDIVNFPGNGIDLTDPKVEPGTLVMIPGGSRALRNWEADVQADVRVNNGSTGTSDFGGNTCNGGVVGSGLGWPADDHTLSGNPYGPGHLGIDISAPEGSNVYAAGSGVVTKAQGGYNYGYGNVIFIDHGNGYVTVYAHLSQINVSLCQVVGQGSLIGYSGNTGNSFGAHLHFEIRRNGTNINPYEIVQ
ncbi:MAG: peptidoglycan DD-metalloendopeptidase family protein [Chloroflexi bacterium]|nr:peptidoglycan DD-metalloendopeptidase family protein [Chloroflexota bacterium]